MDLTQTPKKRAPSGATKKINTENTEKLQSALNSVQERCQERRMEADDVAAIIRRVESALSGILPKKGWRGIRIEAQNGFGSRIPGAYRGTPTSTQVWLERGPSGWFMISCGRTYSWTTGPLSWRFVSLQDKAGEIASHLVGKTY